MDNDPYEDDEPSLTMGDAIVDEDTPTHRVWALKSVSQAFADVVSKRPKPVRPKVGFF